MGATTLSRRGFRSSAISYRRIWRSAVPTMRPVPAACAACASTVLAPHMQVAGEMGAAGLIPTTDRFGSALSDIVRCPACGHMQLERIPADADLAEAYGEAESEDYIEEETGQRATARIALDRIARQVPGGALLDLGCWV